MGLFLYTKSLATYVYILIAVAIVVISLLFSNKLVKELAQEERNKMEIWAEATQLIATEGENSNMNLILHILQSNTTIPVILHDVASNSFVVNNIEISAKNTDSFFKNKISSFSKRHDPIVLEELNQYLYYDDSYTLKMLSVYPYIQLSVVFIFIALAFIAFISSHRAEQNRVWMGLSKETAHQLGTPITSLMAWAELMRIKGVETSLLDDLEKDLDRLEKVAERFSKIGSKSDLKSTDLKDVIDRSVLYMERRISNKVNISIISSDYKLLAAINEPLFEWVIENLIKNATDAMSGVGDITLNLYERNNKIIIDVTDTGRGIEKSKHKKVFTPGYTTKSRGWGLGLSLAKRIIEVYHKGKIYVKSSEIGRGTTFRIVIKKLQ